MNKIFLSLIALVFIAALVAYKIDSAEIVSTDTNSKKIGNFSYFEKKYTFNNKEFLIRGVEVNTQVSDIGITSPETIEKKSNDENLKAYSGYSLEEYAKIGGYKVVQSGGFLSTLSPPIPLGFVKIQGQEYHKVHDSWITTGIFCTNGNDFKIERYSSTKQFDDWLSCIQAGPIMIENGKNELNTDRNTWFITGKEHRQSFICQSYSGSLVMGLAENITLKDLSAFLADGRRNDLSCKEATALNPKGISGIFINTEEVKSLGNIDIPLATAIVVK